MLVERAAGPLLGPDVAIDRFVTDREPLVAAEPPRDLFGTPILAEQRLDLRPFDRGELSIASRSRSTAARVPVGERRAIGTVTVRLIAPHLAADRAAVASQHPSNHR